MILSERVNTKLPKAGLLGILMFASFALPTFSFGARDRRHNSASSSTSRKLPGNETPQEVLRRAVADRLVDAKSAAQKQKGKQQIGTFHGVVLSPDGKPVDGGHVIRCTKHTKLVLPSF